MQTILMDHVQRQLSHLGRRTGLTHATLANEDGLLLASYGTHTESEWMASVSPLVKTATKDDLAVLFESFQSKGLQVKVLDQEVGAQALFLCVAGSSPSSEPELVSFLQHIAQLMEA